MLMGGEHRSSSGVFTSVFGLRETQKESLYILGRDSSIWLMYVCGRPIII